MNFTLKYKHKLHEVEFSSALILRTNVYICRNILNVAFILQAQRAADLIAAKCCSTQQKR